MLAIIKTLAILKKRAGTGFACTGKNTSYSASYSLLIVIASNLSYSSVWATLAIYSLLHAAHTLWKTGILLKFDAPQCGHKLSHSVGFQITTISPIIFTPICFEQDSKLHVYAFHYLCERLMNIFTICLTEYSSETQIAGRNVYRVNVLNLIKNAEGIRNKAIIATLEDTGAKIGEIDTLT